MESLSNLPHEVTELEFEPRLTPELELFLISVLGSITNSLG